MCAWCTADTTAAIAASEGRVARDRDALADVSADAYAWELRGE